MKDKWIRIKCLIVLLIVGVNVRWNDVIMLKWMLIYREKISVKCERLYFDDNLR